MQSAGLAAAQASSASGGGGGMRAGGRIRRSSSSVSGRGKSWQSLKRVKRWLGRMYGATRRSDREIERDDDGGMGDWYDSRVAGVLLVVGAPTALMLGTFVLTLRRIGYI